MRFVTLVVPFACAAVLAVPARAEPAAFGGPKMLIHGNYCGPGNNAPRPPIDALDAACARHDACTPRGGLPSQACNLRLQRDAEAVERDPRQTDDLRALAGIVAAGALMIPVEPDRAASNAPARPVAVAPRGRLSERTAPGVIPDEAGSTDEE